MTVVNDVMVSRFWSRVSSVLPISCMTWNQRCTRPWNNTECAACSRWCARDMRGVILLMECVRALGGSVRGQALLKSRVRGPCIRVNQLELCGPCVDRHIAGH